MKPAAFGYVRPDTLDEVVDALTEGDVLLAGGQSLIPELSERRRFARRLIDLNAVTELEHCAADPGRVRIGALTRHRDIAERRDIAAALPVLSAAARRVGHAAVRTRGTLGGSVANADPAAELPGVCVLLDAVALLRTAAGERTAPVASLLRPGGLREHEVITAVELKPLRGGEGWGFRELSRPGAYAFPLVTVSVTLLLGADGVVTGLRAAVTGAAPAPRAIAQSAARGFLGARPTGDWAAAVAGELAAAADPVTDACASAAYRRRIVAHLGCQAIADARHRAVPGAAA
jgi:carbon-monoxide dehydrogenase medium subunit